MKTVVAALIEKDGRFFLAKRSTGNKGVFGKWEFPGGKVEDGESDEVALEREILEEFNTVVSVGKKIAETPIDDKLMLKLYKCTHGLGNYVPHDHSESAWLDKLEDMYQFDLAPADKRLLNQICPRKDDSRKPGFSELVKGQSYENADLQRIFLISSQGGMRKSNSTNCLVLISKHNSNNPYDDKWNDDHFEYTGMGMNGDQSVNYMQNKTLAESNTNGVTVHLFESFENNDYIYRGIVKLDGEPYFEVQEDQSGRQRKVVKFSLRLVD